MSGNHQGSYLSAKRFVEKVIEFEADIIKFQVYKPDTITFKSTSKDFRVDNGSSWKEYNFLYDLYEKAHTPWDWIENLTTYLDKKKFPWFASPFDHTAVNFLEDIGCSAYKVASPEITDIGLIETLSKTGKPIILSTGVATKEDIDLAMTKGVNYPKGLLLWADELGIDNVLRQLEDLQSEYGEDRYRPSPILKRMVKENKNFY